MQHFLRPCRYRYPVPRLPAPARPWSIPHARPYSEHPFSDSKQPRSSSQIFSRLTPTVLVIGFIPIFTFALGTWQVRRRRWKLDLIEQLNDQLHREPLELPPFVNVDVLPEFSFRKVILKGRWDHARAVLVGPKTRDGVHGYHVITPFVRSDGGSTVLVDRGFVSKAFAAQRSYWQPQAGDGDDQYVVLGMLNTTPQPKNRFTPDNKPDKGEWYWIDVDAIKEWAGGDEKRVQSVFVEQLYDGNTGEVADLISRGVPVGRSGEIELRNMHATYALTWYSLSAATAIMFVGLLRRPRPSSTRLPFR